MSDKMITISIKVPRQNALEFKTFLSEYGQQARAIRKFISVYIMTARAARGKPEIRIKELINDAAKEAADTLIKGGI